MKNCKICEALTNNVFGIDFKTVPICEGCANVIFLQQAQWYAKQDVEKLNKPPVSGSVADAVGRNCPFCGEPCAECSHKATDG